MENEITNDRRVKRRAARACRSCRSRKVRCDVVESGPPCTNCRLDAVECMIATNRRHRVPRSRLQVPSTVEELPVANVGRNDNQILDLSKLTTSIGTSLQQDKNRECYSFLTLSEPAGQIATTTSPDSSQCFHGHYPFDCAPTIGRRAEDNITIPPLPAFITPLPETLESTDLLFLSQKGALSLPHAEFRDICLSRYLEFVHPLLPLLDSRDFLTILQRGTGEGTTISLLLFNAVMCAGLAFVEKVHIVLAGYSSKKSARMAFFKKAKLLYSLSVEPDRFILIQSAILLSNWYAGAEEKMDPWFWSGTAISMGHTIGLHLDPIESKVGKEKAKLWRRLWWTCFGREQKLALALGRPARVSYYDVPMLTLNDFDISVLPHDMSIIERTLGRDTRRQELLAISCIEHMKLCVCVGHIVSAIFASRRHQNGAFRDIYSDPSIHSPYEDLDSCAEHIEKWATQTPRELWYKTLTKKKYDVADRCVLMATVNNHILYYLAISALYRHKALSSSPSSDYCDLQGLQRNSQRIVRHAAREMTRVNQHLHQLGLLRYSSTTSIGTVVAAAVVHLLDVKSTNPVLRSAALHGIQQCMEFLQVLSEAYGTTVNALQFLRAATRSGGILVIEPTTHDDTPPPEVLQKPLPTKSVSSPTTMHPESPSWAIQDELFWETCLNIEPEADFFGDIYMADYDAAGSLEDPASLQLPDL